MKILPASQLFLGSIVVYAIMAACNASSGPPNDAPSRNSGSSGGTSPSSGFVSDGQGSGSGGQSLLDALTDPVAEANAQSLPPITATEDCNKTTPTNDAGGITIYAEHSFPGYTAQQLARVLSLVTPSVPNNPLATAGYSQYVAPTYVRDGYAAAWCGYVGSQGSQVVQSVTFILSQ
jgi:hypothetical protein